MNKYEEFCIWIAKWLSNYLQISDSDVTEETVFAEAGVDSIGAVTLVGDLEAYKGRPYDDTLLWDYPTVGQLANYLTEQELF